MNKVIATTLIGSSLLFGFDIKVNVTDVRNESGKVYIGLYNTSNGFTEVSQTFQEKIIDSKVGTIEYTFQNIDKGTYAISVFHDENENGELDKNLFGVPKEGYGFSKNNRFLLRAATFEESNFIVNNDTNLTINIGY